MSFFVWQLCCLSFDLRILLTPLVSSNGSYNILLKHNCDTLQTKEVAFLIKKKGALFFLSNTNASGTHLFETRLMNDSSCVITWVQKSIVWERGHNSSVYLGTHPEKQSYNFSIRPLFCFRCILSMTCI